MVFFGLESERVDVDTDRGDVFVMLIGLDVVEVVTITFREAIMTIELEFGKLNRVKTGVGGTEVSEIQARVRSSYTAGIGAKGAGRNTSAPGKVLFSGVVKPLGTAN